jgi:hypothetical protein
MTTSPNDFIFLPAKEIITDVINSSVGVGNGIETFPLCDYIMQSVFIKMTGFQEQKMKSICWGLALNDYDYRYKLTKSPLGECSSYEDKEQVYGDLFTEIKKLNPVFKIGHAVDKVKLLEDTAAEIQRGFDSTNLSIWAQRSFDDYSRIWMQVKSPHFAVDDKVLFPNAGLGFSLRKIYIDHLYRHRNRIAHNTQSYQQNLPTLKTLLNEAYRYENYFLYFSLIVLIDNLFMKLFEIHENLCKEIAQ